MEIKVVNPGVVIKDLQVNELVNFTIITGLNGSGKTHLLKAIDAGNVQIDAVVAENTKYLSLADFKFTNEKPRPFNEVSQLTNSAWDRCFVQSNGSMLKDYADSLQVKYFVSNENGENIDIWDSSDEEYKYIWSNPSVTGQSDPLASIRGEYIKEIETLVFKNTQFKSQQYLYDVYKAIRTLDKPITKITEKEFKDIFVPVNHNHSLLSSSLSTLYMNYKTSQLNWAIDEDYRLGEASGSLSSLKRQYESIFPRPWDKLNEIIRKIHSSGEGNTVFDFVITHPGEDNLKATEINDYKFVPKIADIEGNEVRDFSSLSSGEQILLALTLTMFESEDSSILPEVLLLDEIDASLHPSMTRALLATINSAFIENGIKVILVTHSPSTIALAEEENVFVLEQSAGQHTLKKQTKKKALDLLTEGYATLENGVAIFNEVARGDIAIITEGHNASLIEKACELYGIDNVNVIKEFYFNSGWSQLNQMHGFFSLANLEKSVLFVYDHDVQEGDRPSEIKSCLVYGFEKNESNNLAAKGIENLFPEDVIRKFNTDGTLLETRHTDKGDLPKFVKNEKTSFAERIIAEGKKEDFKCFEPLLARIEGILKKSKRKPVEETAMKVAQ